MSDDESEFDEADDDDGPVLEIPSALDGERIDRVVALLTGRPRSAVTTLIAEGAVSLAGTVVSVPRLRVKAGELLAIDARVAQVLQKAVVPPSSTDVPFTVVYDDPSVIVVDKPAGVVVHPGAGHHEDTLVAGLIARYAELGSWPSEVSDPLRPGIVHRLDKDTSGLLVVARTPEAYFDLVEQLRTRTMHRQYRSLVVGQLGPSAGSIEAPIGRSSRQRTSMVVSASGKPATTHYRVLERFCEPIDTTLLEINLETGRTHQIRVHFAAIGHPVLGDRRYGGAVSGLVVDRPFLHAEELTFRHPQSGDEMTFHSDLPEGLQSILERCGTSQTPIS